MDLSNLTAFDWFIGCFFILQVVAGVLAGVWVLGCEYGRKSCNEPDWLLDVLEPFANCENGWTAGLSDAITVTELGSNFGLRGGPTLGHCRAARKALEAGNV